MGIDYFATAPLTLVWALVIFHICTTYSMSTDYFTSTRMIHSMGTYNFWTALMIHNKHNAPEVTFGIVKNFLKIVCDNLEKEHKEMNIKLKNFGDFLDVSNIVYSRFWRSENSPYWMQRKMLSDESSAYLHYTKASQNVLVLMIHLRKRSGRWVIYE